MSKGVKFTPESARRIAHATRRVEKMPYGNGGVRQDSHASDGELLLLIADADLTSPATNPFDGAKYVPATVIVPDGSGAAWTPTTYTPQGMKLGTRTEYVVSRSIDAQFLKDTMIMAMRCHGEWLLIWHDCSPTERPS